MSGRTMTDPVALAIRWVRKAHKKGLSIRQIAKIIDMSSSTVHRWLEGPLNLEERHEQQMRCPHKNTARRIMVAVENVRITGNRATVKVEGADE